MIPIYLTGWINPWVRAFVDVQRNLLCVDACSLGVKRFDTVEELLASSDVVSVNCDLNAENHHLLNETTLSNIPPNKGVRPLLSSRSAEI